CPRKRVCAIRPCRSRTGRHWPAEAIGVPLAVQEPSAAGAVPRREGRRCCCDRSAHADEWSVVSDCGLSVSMGYPSRRETFIETGFNDPANHAMLLKELEVAIPLAARAHVPNLIAMFGKRNSLIDRSAAIDHCIAGLARIAPLATQSGVTICVELLNSKVDHPRYEGDHTAFGAAVMQGVSSPHVKLLYDIYHMQIME